MPRYTISPEEFALIEKLRAKNAKNLGYNEGLEVAAQQLINFVAVPGETSKEQLVEQIRSLKRELES